MINRGTFDQREDAAEAFEADWSVDSRGSIEGTLRNYGLENDLTAIVELVRIDIELRYDRGANVDIDDYLNRFESLRESPEQIAEIAFEDYRGRSANGFSVAPTRWDSLPSINHQSWFRQLSGHSTRRSSGRRSSARLGRIPVDPQQDRAFESALAEAGFELVQEIGQGAFSRVYLANQSDLADRFVVLKIVNEALEESERMALLQHTNIVPIYSCHRILNRSVICMPYAGSVTLSEFLKAKADVSSRRGESLVTTVRAKIDDTKIARRDAEINESDPSRSEHAPAADDDAVLRPMDVFRSFSCPELANWIFQRLAGALAHAHARGVLHNDLKPSNVLIRNDGEPALLDFNLSQSLQGSVSGYAGGTLPYMSPETYQVMMGQQIQPRTASDLYGLGVMLFEFVTGRLPFPTPQSIAPIDLAPAIAARRGSPQWRSDDEVTPGLKAIIERCLRFQPDSRYASADEMQADLLAEQQNQSLVHTTEPARYRAIKWTRRHPRTIWLSLAAVCLVVILTPVLSAMSQLRSENVSLASQNDYNAFRAESNEFFNSMMSDPQRRNETTISNAVDLLDRHGILDPQKADRLLAGQSSEQKAASRDVIFRHLVNVAIIEESLLSSRRLSDPSAASDFTRLDQLITAAKQHCVHSPSRAIRFLQVGRARLAGDDGAYQRHLTDAKSTGIGSDTELYLDAVRRISTYDYEGANRQLTELADRKSMPSGLRWNMLGYTQYNLGPLPRIQIVLHPVD